MGDFSRRQSRNTASKVTLATLDTFNPEKR
jgi:hypothetical protein